jgi:hypothetical protein
MVHVLAVRARVLALALAALALAAAGPATTRVPEPAARAFESVTAEHLRSFVERLASDEFAGRGVGHDGNVRAERFAADALKDAGVPPAADGDSYFQPVELRHTSLGRARLTIAAADGTPMADLTVGDSFCPLPESGAGEATGRLVYAGFGLSAPGLRHDDYARVDARGAIVLALDGTPERLDLSRMPDAERSGFASVERKRADAERHGARGLLIVRPYIGDVRAAWPEQPSVRTMTYRLANDLDAHPMPVAAISTHEAAPLQRALAGRQTLTATLTPDLVVERVTVHNVLGFVEGADPSKRSEMVVVGAHLDHDGIDAEGRIYHGADDNASGTAAVLADAAAFADAAAHGSRPARAVVFALWNGEEKGSLGAEAYVASPVPHRRVAANINLDMVGRDEDIPDPGDWRFHGLPRTSAAASRNTVHVLGYSWSDDLARLVVDANAATGLTILEDYDRGAQNLLQRSDNWPFLTHGIPAVFLTTGLHPDYHTPEDSADRLDYPKLERIARLAARAAWLAADGPPSRMAKR